MRMLINAEEGTSKVNKTISQLVCEASHLDWVPGFIHPVSRVFSAQGLYLGIQQGIKTFQIPSKTLTQTLNLV